MSIDALPHIDKSFTLDVDRPDNPGRLTTDEQGKWDRLEEVLGLENRPVIQQMAEVAFVGLVDRQPPSVTDPTAWDYQPGDERVFLNDSSATPEQGDGLPYRFHG